jgi:hypothetical protein
VLLIDHHEIEPRRAEDLDRGRVGRFDEAAPHQFAAGDPFAKAGLAGLRWHGFVLSGVSPAMMGCRLFIGIPGEA